MKKKIKRRRTLPYFKEINEANLLRLSKAVVPAKWVIAADFASCSYRHHQTEGDAKLRDEIKTERKIELKWKRKVEQEAGRSEDKIYCSKETKQNRPWGFITVENHLTYFWFRRKFTPWIGHSKSVNHRDRLLMRMVCITVVAVVISCDSFTDRLLHDRQTAHQALKCLQTAKRSSGASDLGRTHYTSLSLISWHSSLGRQKLSEAELVISTSCKTTS